MGRGEPALRGVRLPARPPDQERPAQQLQRHVVAVPPQVRHRRHEMPTRQHGTFEFALVLILGKVSFGRQDVTQLVLVYEHGLTYRD